MENKQTKNNVIRETEYLSDVDLNQLEAGMGCETCGKSCANGGQNIVNPDTHKVARRLTFLDFTGQGRRRSLNLAEYLRKRRR